MRISGGTLKGRRFNAPSGHVSHPMSERIKMALFNMLGDIEDLSVLDAFGGSGSLSFEAISLGAHTALVVEKDKNSHRTIQENIAELNLEEQVKAVRANVASWSENNSEEQFDLVFCDPPYDDLQLKTVDKLVKHLKPKGLMVLSHPGSRSAPTVNGVVVVDNRLYGDAALAFYRLES